MEGVGNFVYNGGVAGAAWLAVGTWRAMPFPIAYANELAGGPEGAHHWFVDAQLDWGQGLVALGDWQAKHPEAAPLYLAYFSAGWPEEYGIRSEPLPSPLSPCQPPAGRWPASRFPKSFRGWIAISETTLKGTYAHFANLPTDYYADLENEPVVARLAYSIRIIHRP